MLIWAFIQTRMGPIVKKLKKHFKIRAHPKYTLTLNNNWLFQDGISQDLLIDVTGKRF